MEVKHLDEPVDSWYHVTHRVVLHDVVDVQQGSTWEEVVYRIREGAWLLTRQKGTDLTRAVNKRENTVCFLAKYLGHYHAPILVL